MPPLSTRSALRAEVEEISARQCEHPAIPFKNVVRCRDAMTEMAHIYPRGMGHTGYRDHINNVMAACDIHARSTDDLSSVEWAAVAQWAGASPGREEQAAYRSWLQQWVHELRTRQGWAMPALLVRSVT